MAEPARVYSTGSILVDLAIDVPALPERGGDVLASATRTLVGGGFNLAAAVARQQVPCSYAAPHGSGRYGDLVRAALAAEGIEPAGPRRAGGDTGFCLALIEPDGERTFVTVPGVEAELRPDELAAVPVRPGDIVAVSGYDLLYPGSGPVLAGWLGGLDPTVRVALDPGPLVLRHPGRPAGRGDGGAVGTHPQPARGPAARRGRRTPPDRRCWPRCGRVRARRCGRPRCWWSGRDRTGAWPPAVGSATGWSACRRRRCARWTPPGPATPTPACCWPSWPGPAGRGRTGLGEPGRRDLGDPGGLGHGAAPRRDDPDGLSVRGYRVPVKRQRVWL